jgi:hypothetical protein
MARSGRGFERKRKVFECATSSRAGAVIPTALKLRLSSRLS